MSKKNLSITAGIILIGIILFLIFRKPPAPIDTTSPQPSIQTSPIETTPIETPPREVPPTSEKQSSTTQNKTSPVVKKEQANIAPQFTLYDLEGYPVSLSNFLGKVVILDFWATWCPPCLKEIPHFIELYEEYKDKGLEIIGVTLDDPAATKDFVESWQIPYTIVMGTEKVSRDYGNISAIPTTFVLNKNGEIYKKYVGYREKEVFEKDLHELGLSS